MKTTKIIILLTLLVVASMGGISPVAAQIDASTPSYERPVIEESVFEQLKTQDKAGNSEEMEWLKWALAIVLLSLIAAGGVTAYRARRSPKKTKKS